MFSVLPQLLITTTNLFYLRVSFLQTTHDHGLLRIRLKGEKPLSWRVTFNQWKIRGCPEHGPAISISDNNRYYIAWFTQGSIRQGLFYAYSSDQGRHFSHPLSFGIPENMSGYPDIMANRKHASLRGLNQTGPKCNFQLCNRSIWGGTGCRLSQLQKAQRVLISHFY